MDFSYPVKEQTEGTNKVPIPLCKHCKGYIQGTKGPHFSDNWKFWEKKGSNQANKTGKIMVTKFVIYCFEFY